MNYRHVYHAGSFTDVVKHIILVALLNASSRKETAFCYVDTHAGSGYYDLYSELAAHTKEYQKGISKIIQQNHVPPLIKLYLDCIRQINNRLTGSNFASLQYYPGSPMIARHFLRPQDRIIACEWQPQEYQILKSVFANDKVIN